VPALKQPSPTEPLRDLYDRDFYEWCMRMAQSIRARRVSDLDWEHMAEEIEDMGKRDYRELESRLRLIIMHLLKWQFQPSQRSASWKSTIRLERAEVAGILLQSPSLRPRIADALRHVYSEALQNAIDETGISPDSFPPPVPIPSTSSSIPSIGHNRQARAHARLQRFAGINHNLRLRDRLKDRADALV
jgi:Domain of unknown function DUF29